MPVHPRFSRLLSGASRFFGFALGLMMLSASGQTRGGLELFTNEANALSWRVFDFNDESFYEPEWDPETGNADVFTIVSPNSGVSIFADNDSSGGALVGDFRGKQIAGVGCAAYVGDASALRFAEFFIRSEGVFYYSIDFSSPTFFAADGWQEISADFEGNPWFVFVDGEFEEVELTQEILSTVVEIGVNFFVDDSRTEVMLVSVDDFYLYPELLVPELTTNINGSDFEISFVREEGQKYNVMTSTTLGGWMGLTGQEEITGTSAYTLSDPVIEKKFYRVETDFSFVVIPDVDTP